MSTKAELIERGSEPVTMIREQMESVQEMLMIGLRSFGSVTESINACDLAEMGGKQLRDGVRPQHPTGSADTVAKFADALIMVQDALTRPTAE